MNILKKLIFLFATVAMLGSTNNAEAVTYCTDAGGCGYAQCRTAPCIAPAIALGTLALAAIIAVMIQNSSGGSGNGHAHSSSH